MMDLSGQRILVIGLGKTGMATARFLSRQGADVVVTDEKAPSELKEALDAAAAGGCELPVPSLCPGYPVGRGNGYSIPGRLPLQPDAVWKRCTEASRF